MESVSAEGHQSQHSGLSREAGNGQMASLPCLLPVYTDVTAPPTRCPSTLFHHEGLCEIRHVTQQLLKLAECGYTDSPTSVTSTRPIKTLV